MVSEIYVVKDEENPKTAFGKSVDFTWCGVRVKHGASFSEGCNRVKEELNLINIAISI